MLLPFKNSVVSTEDVRMIHRLCRGEGSTIVSSDINSDSDMLILYC
jgi:hypothetical protein